MADTGFAVPTAKRDRLTSYDRTDPDRGPTLADDPDGQWSTMPAFPSRAGGLVSTVDDWFAFARMLLARGATSCGTRLLSSESVDQMTTDHLTDAQREIGDGEAAPELNRWEAIHAAGSGSRGCPGRVRSECRETVPRRTVR